MSVEASSAHAVAGVRASEKCRSPLMALAQNHFLERRVLSASVRWFYRASLLVWVVLLVGSALGYGFPLYLPTLRWLLPGSPWRLTLPDGTEDTFTSHGAEDGSKGLAPDPVRRPGAKGSIQLVQRQRPFQLAPKEVARDVRA